MDKEKIIEENIEDIPETYIILDDDNIAEYESAIIPEDSKIEFIEEETEINPLEETEEQETEESEG